MITCCRSWCWKSYFKGIEAWDELIVMIKRWEPKQRWSPILMRNMLNNVIWFILAVSVSANRWSVAICSMFLPKSHYTHHTITCWWADFHVGRRRGLWWSYSSARRAAKPVTAVQDCVSTFVSVPALEYLKETSGQFPDMCPVTRDVKW